MLCSTVAQFSVKLWRSPFCSVERETTMSQQKGGRSDHLLSVTTFSPDGTDLFRRYSWTGRRNNTRPAQSQRVNLSDTTRHLLFKVKRKTT